MRAVLPLLLACCLAGCLAGTHAEDPLPGPARRSAVVAAENGLLSVRASVLVELDEAEAREAAAAIAARGPQVEGATTRVDVAVEAPGFTRIQVEQGPFPLGPDAEARADEVRKRWLEILDSLRAK